MTTNNKGVQIIRLDRSRTDRAFRKEESLWENELYRIFDLLNEHAKSLKNLIDKKRSKEPSVEELPLLSIGLFGSPGSGKTSLLKTLVRRVNSENSEDIPREIRNKIYSLPVIKPNYQSSDDHFLYAFLATALNAERKLHETEEKQYYSSSILSGVQQKFQEVSEYLQVINKTERPQEDDPLGVSLDRLERHESDLLLGKTLEGFIDELANSLMGTTDESKVILMPVDDADLSFEILKSALDTHWRYLQHPRLVPVFTFTGRLAEELLRVNFEENLTVETLRESFKKLKTAYSSLLITENMAIQYLSRLFPVRNRIILDPASARVLAANYTKYSSSNKENDEGRAVIKLLKKSSELLFGNSYRLVPKVRAPLRMLTLRRQIQIVDAMSATGVEVFVDFENAANSYEQEEITESEYKKLLKELYEQIEKSWGQLFDTSTWALLNSHRDILKEINVNFDDLYRWTPQGLRSVLLNSILNLPLNKRSELRNHWCYRSEDCRSQIISLLAANIFRPRMEGEEGTGDDSDIYRLQYKSDKKKSRSKTAEPSSDDSENQGNNNPNLSFLVQHGAVWFLRLCIGFYLPQLLTAGKVSPSVDIENDTENDSNTNSEITGVGWGLMSGPLHAVQGVVNSGGPFACGMMFLDPVILSEKIRQNTKASLLLHIWCFFGCEGDRLWTALSLWRGLGLLGRLLEIDMDYKTDSEDEKRELIKNHLEKHLEEALVVGNLPEKKPGKKPGTGGKEIIFREWKSEDDTSLNNLANELLRWQKKFQAGTENKENRIFPLMVEPKSDEAKSDGNGGEEEWKRCFIRRIHGENIVSSFLKDLEKVYFEKSLEEWRANSLLERWYLLLNDYWEDCEGNIRNLLLSCPFLLPFITGEKAKELGINSQESLKILKWSKVADNFDIPCGAK